MLVAPERRMSSCEMTWIAEAESSNFCGCRVTEVTSTFMKSSTLSIFKLLVETSSAKPQRGASRVSTMAAIAHAECAGERGAAMFSRPDWVTRDSPGILGYRRRGPDLDPGM